MCYDFRRTLTLRILFLDFSPSYVRWQKKRFCPSTNIVLKTISGISTHYFKSLYCFAVDTLLTFGDSVIAVQKGANSVKSLSLEMSLCGLDK